MYTKYEELNRLNARGVMSRPKSPALKAWIWALPVLATALVLPAVVFAQAEEEGGLVGLPYANDIERAAASANQSVFVQLSQLCDPNDELGRTPSPGAPPPGATSACTEDVFFVFQNSRELVHTANEIRGGQGPTIASLGLDQQGLGTALRWTAAEEFAVQSSMATDFASNQLSNLAARMSALRFGARGFTASLFLEGTEIDGPILAYGAQRRRGGGASADEESETYSPWGGFVNGSFGYGAKDPTSLENAFDFDGSEVTAGIDYRFRNNLVVGGIGGFTKQNVDFDESASQISVVDGEIESDGWSLILFSLYQGDRLTFNASLGHQSLDYKAVRNIKYPSFNPDIESANSIARSEPDSRLISGSVSLGYALNVGRLNIEPYVRADYQDVTIDEFTEERSVNALSGNRDTRNFDLVIGKQTLQSFDSALGLTLQLPLTPQFGVIVPYVTVEAHKESRTDSRVIVAEYSALPGSFDDPANAFRIPTDERDGNYYTVAVGISTVLRGGRQRTADGPITGGLMGFIQYKTVEDLDFYDDQVITGGLRYEF
jgi:uncharacterized protein YhjY with autotransporter beta-barrel domain